MGFPFATKRRLLTLFIAVICLKLISCGQTGELTLPDAKPSPAPQANIETSND